MILDTKFLDSYRSRPIDWGFKSGPNSLGELVYRRTYRRGEETWVDTLSRVTEGTYEIIMNHCERNGLPFDMKQAKEDAKEFLDGMFNFRWLPPGRGLWMMGTDFVRLRGSMPLQNCAFVSTKDIDKELCKPFRFLMDVSMLGTGCGFDTRGKGKIKWQPSSAVDSVFDIPDCREGWIESTGMMLRWGFGHGPEPRFDYSLIRPRGTPIKGFGGVCEGPEALVVLHNRLRELILRRSWELISSRDIVDIMNMIGACVVAGNVRRTAEIAFGDPDDTEFLDLKNYKINPDRMEYGWTSNNSIFAEVGMDYIPPATRTAINGEPGYAWLANMRRYGRMVDPMTNADYRVMGGNPCLEQSLEPYEVCTLVETFPARHDSLEQYRRTLKYAFLYAKAVTLMPTHWKETNAVVMRNRRIGCSMSGITQFLYKYSTSSLIDWCDEGYATVKHYDKVYSEWLGVRESIKKTSVKPSGTVSLLAGATPGCHWPERQYYIRRVRFGDTHPDLEAIRAAGYHTEPDQYSANTTVVELPIKGDEDVPTQDTIDISTKVELAVLMQRWWADNQVSCTVTFDPETEGKLIAPLLSQNDKDLKGISFLPTTKEGAYAQMPYEAITKEVYEERIKNLKPIQWGERSSHADEDKYCDGAACLIQS